VLESEEIQRQVIREFKESRGNRGKMLQLTKILETDEVGHIRIDKAPEPEEIIWHHINTSRRSKRLRQLLGWIFTVLFMAAITGIFYLVIK
jgi:hypothetical protein